MTVNPVDQAVIAQGLIAAAREMGIKLIRSAYSPIVREAADCSAALLDRHGNVVAQAELIPMQLGPIGATFKPCAELFPPEDLVEGDFYINNDPFQGGQHVPDVFLFSPIFFDGELVGFSATVAHHLDLGGGAPGLNPDATDVHQEGLIFPPSKYNLNRDWNGGPFERLVRANIRVPDQTIGDFNAQFAANHIGAGRVRDLCAKFGSGTVAEAMDELLNYSERRMRAAISEAPDGVYYGEDALDDDGVGDRPLPFRAKVTIAGDQVSVDFAGTADQV
ncbi:MAG: hydantoinase B/oxoprolinase family protein, partial [Minwuiales bacterium]|nr:hydantoinase B/oxoprolinase family protein [Minwuiales bacterium]